MIESKQIEEGRLTAQMVRAMKQHEMVCHYTLMDEMLESPRAESIMHPGKYLCLPTRGDFKMILEGEGQKYEEQIKWKHDGPTYGKDGWDDRRLIFEDSPYTVKTEPAEGDVLECFTIYPHKGTGLHLLHGSRYSTGRVLSSTGLAVEIYQLSKYNRDELKDQRVYLLLASTPWDERDKEPAERKLTDFDYLRFLRWITTGMWRMARGFSFMTKIKTANIETGTTWLSPRFILTWAETTAPSMSGIGAPV